MNSDITEVYDEYLNLSTKLMGRHPPLLIAGIMMSQAMSLYKTILTNSEYDEMVNTVAESRDQIKEFRFPTLQ